MQKPAMFIFGMAMALLVAAAAVIEIGRPRVSAAAAAKQAASDPAMVEENMHEFMEYVFEPTYLRLKQQMAVEKKDRPVWKQIKSDALILAEASTLTMMRGANDSADWNKFCESVRDSGGQLYQAAKKSDAQTAGKHYLAMLEQCNACHKKFAGGEHQLKP